jgi:hypothetical protein
MTGELFNLAASMTALAVEELSFPKKTIQRDEQR